MIKPIYIIAPVMMFMAFCCEANGQDNTDVASNPTNVSWLSVGEKLTYKLYWGIIPVGRAEFATDWVEEEGKKLLSLKATARTTSIVAKIYPVDDFIESIVDPETFLPVRYTQRLVEGKHRRNDQVLFYHDKKKAVWESTKNDESHDIAIDVDTRDVMTLAYYMRSKGSGVGQEERFRVLVDDKIFDLMVKGMNLEKMNVKGFGKDIKCLRLEPKARFGGIFVRKGRVQMWFSEDARRVCVRVKAKVALANLRAVLKSVDGPDVDRWTKKKK